MGSTNGISPDHPGPGMTAAENYAAPAGLDHQDRHIIWQNLYTVLTRLSNRTVSRETDELFVSTSLELANVSFVLGKGFSDLSVFLESAREAARRIGDRRSHAIITLHIARLMYFAEQRQEALALFERGKSEVEALGDDDIQSQAAEFIGLYFFVQGLFDDALHYFEQATQSFEFFKTGQAINPSGPMWMSYCAAFLGHYHRAIGTLDYYRRIATDRGDRPLATTLRAVLGITLAGINKHREAAFHLSGALQEAKRDRNAMACYFAKGGLAYHHLIEGRIEESRKWLQEAIHVGAPSGLIRQYASPWVLELLFEYHRHGLEPIPELTYPRETQRILQEPNIHLRGVALRLRAMESAANNDNPRSIESALQRSEACLKRSGDPVQLAKTRIELARLKLRQGEPEAARALAQKAWKAISGYGDAFYPDDLRHLLAFKEEILPSSTRHNELMEMFTDMIENLVPSSDIEELLGQTVKATNRFFSAERGGIFWFPRQPARRGPELRAAFNLSQSDVASEMFKSSLAVIFKACRENKPQVVRSSQSLLPSQLKAMMGVPFEVDGQVQGVLYHDNSYLNDCFAHFDDAQLLRMARALTRFIAQVMRYNRQMEQKTTAHLNRLDRVEPSRIITESPVMATILDQADRIATTDSTVLILGETGVGKELLARRIHSQSHRSEHPLVIVDPTAIPESLVESELFGHEKGAFTGADRRKPGRLELAHKGTLFIDEVGEIPLSIQVKLLRAIQEKTLTRVGGTATICSDFRLIAATNRDLENEVAAGRFREDLYYRLNVIPMVLPPLRDRGDDVLLLASHFQTRYCAKYNQRPRPLSPKEEAELLEYHWPGNVRELQNVVERAALLSSGEGLEFTLPSVRKSLPNHPFVDTPTLEEVQRRYIRFILEKTDGKIAGSGGAAELLGMKRTSLYNRMNKLGMRK